MVWCAHLLLQALEKVCPSVLQTGAYSAVHKQGSPMQDTRHQCSDSKLFQLPSHPPKVNGSQVLEEVLKYQRVSEDLHGPGSAGSWQRVSGDLVLDEVTVRSRKSRRRLRVIWIVVVCLLGVLVEEAT